MDKVLYSTHESPECSDVINILAHTVHTLLIFAHCNHSWVMACGWPGAVFHAPPWSAPLRTGPLQGDIKPTLCDLQLPHWVPACFTESQSAQNTQNPAESLHESLDLSIASHQVASLPPRARQVVDEPFNYGYALRRPIASNGPGTICTQPNDPMELGIGP